MPADIQQLRSNDWRNEFAAGDFRRGQDDAAAGRSQLERLNDFHQRHADDASAALDALRKTVIHGGNVFDALMHTVRYCSLGQITDALFAVGGQYRRNM